MKKLTVIYVFILMLTIFILNGCKNHNEHNFTLNDMQADASTSIKETVDDAMSIWTSIEATIETTIETVIDNIPIENINENIEEIKNLKQKYLLPIDNPDYAYTSYPIILSDYDRERLAHLVMGEFGTGGFIGCALIAQSVRDAMVKFGYKSVDEVIVKMRYSGWYAGQPSDFVYEAIDYIFTQGNAAVQHEILVMYASHILYSSWHEAQEFVVQYQTVRFFDYWN